MLRKFLSIFMVLLMAWNITFIVFATDTTDTAETVVEDEFPPFDMSPLYDQGIYDLGMVAGIGDDGKIFRYDKLIEPTALLLDDAIFIGALFSVAMSGFLFSDSSQKSLTDFGNAIVSDSVDIATKETFGIMGQHIINGEGFSVADIEGLDNAISETQSLVSLLAMGDDYIFDSTNSFNGNFSSTSYTSDYSWQLSGFSGPIHIEPDFFITMPIEGASTVFALGGYLDLYYHGLFVDEHGPYYYFGGINSGGSIYENFSTFNVVDCSGMTPYDYIPVASPLNNTRFNDFRFAFINAHDAFECSQYRSSSCADFFTTTSQAIFDSSTNLLTFTDLGEFKGGSLLPGLYDKSVPFNPVHYWGKTGIEKDTPISYTPSANISQDFLDGSVAVQPGDALKDDEDIEMFIRSLSPDLVDDMLDTGYIADTATVPEEGTDTENPAIPYAPAIPTPEGFELPNIMVTKFPFCIPFDLYNSINSLVATPVPPRFEWEFYIESIGYSQTFIIDFEDFEELANIVRYFSGAGFVLGLILITRRLIKG